MKNTIFYGNGINLLGGGKNWDQILMQMSEKKFMPPIKSNTLKYEYIILPQKETQHAKIITSDGKELITSNNKYLLVKVHTEDNIKRNLCLELEHFTPSYFYERLKELNADNYITTNYELFLPKMYEDGLNIIESDSLLTKHRKINNNGNEITFWNIHGDTEDSNNILLGLSDYCKYVAEIDSYLKNAKPQDSLSWVNLFFETNVHIIGFGMGDEEIDLWNVLTTRKRKKRKNNNECSNNIYYYSIQDNSFDCGKKELLKSMEVNVIDIEFDWTERAYENAYENAYEIIKEEIANNKA